jgi:hypothetical protein
MITKYFTLNSKARVSRALRLVEIEAELGLPLDIHTPRPQLAKRWEALLNERFDLIFEVDDQSS